MAALSYARARCSGYGRASARPQYAQCRAGNVVRILRRSQPGVSGIRRRACRARLRRVIRQPRRAVLDRARIRGLFRAARHVLSRPTVRQGRGRAVGPGPEVRTLDERAAEIEAVMDAVGFERAALFGASEGGPALHRLRGNTTGANAGVDSHRLLRVLLRRRLGRLRARSGRAAGAPRARAG